MNRILTALALGLILLIPTAASADTPGCVSMSEYNNMDRYLTTGQVANRFDTNGWYINTGPERFKRGYDPCWTNQRKVVVWYDLTTGLSDDWAVQDN